MFLLFVFNTLIFSTLAQNSPKGTAAIPKALTFFSGRNIFPGNRLFIENKGQYDALKPRGMEMERVLYGFEGFNGPVLFTATGLIFVQQKREKLPAAREEEMERKGMPEADAAHSYSKISQVVTLQWVGAAADVPVKCESPAPGYFTYGGMQKMAHGYTTLVYPNIYPGIDLRFQISPSAEVGFEYRFVVHTGADAGLIKMKFGGDAGKIFIDQNGRLAIPSAADTIYQSAPYTFNTSSIAAALRFVADKNEVTTVGSRFVTGNDNTASFAIDAPNRNGLLVIDPFVTTASGFNGLNGQIAKEVDFDYQGNVYVSGGGDYFATQLSKFNAAGVLQWTFSGSLIPPQPDWAFGREYGGFAVEKSTGKVYLGQGFNPVEGTRIIRLQTSGLYDNYISTGDDNFRECWKLIWNCANGNPQILLCGGSTASNVNFSVLSPPGTSIAPVNITGVATGNNQDIADAVVDPLTNEMYTIYASVVAANGIDNNIFKHTFPYSASTIAWRTPVGFANLSEAKNQPFLNTPGANTGNSIHALAVNSNYLFYWDGKELKAFNKATGAGVGTGVTTSLNPKFQAGIYADECNNVFTGYNNGLIKVYRFNGLVFDDAAAPDITIAGFADRSVYDLTYNEGERLLYACGNGFVASYDISAYCPGTVYTVNVTTDCPSLSATAVLTPAAPAGSLVTYSLFAGATLLASNNTGVFTGLTPATAYSVKAFINQACSGAQSGLTNFSLAPCFAVTASVVNAICSSPNGAITASANFGTGPYQYSINGVNFQNSNIFSGLLPGPYTVSVRDFLGEIKTAAVTVGNNVPVITLTPAVTPATCGFANGAIGLTAAGGTAPYQYSLNGGALQPANTFNGLAAGPYTIAVKDANNCMANIPVQVTAVVPPVITAAVTAATCGLNNGNIQVAVTGGSGPFSYAINGGAYQAGNTFTLLAPGNYSLALKDGNNCIAVTTANVAATPLLQASFSSSPANCNNNNGTITVIATGGTLPYSYSINAAPGQPQGGFTGLGAGNYNVQVRDFSGCTVAQPVSVALVNDITVNAGPNLEICAGNQVQINAVAGNADAYSWLPAAGLNNSNMLQPVASPAVTTVYILTASKGPCIRTDTVEIIVNPRPVANAGPDSAICFGGSLQLQGSGGLTYQWTPATSLSNPAIANPLVMAPPRTVTYSLRVTDVKGCPSVETDAVTITVLPPAQLFAGNDTTIVAGQPLQFFAQDINNTGFTQYNWIPATGLSSTVIANPVAILDNSIRYRITASSPQGCTGTDEVNVTVFKKPEIYVPTAFSPNNDGVNDIAFAVPVGIRTFKYFRIYNRWGQMVFSTGNFRQGWSGIFKGMEQGTGAFVWTAEAVDYSGQILFRKGVITLIR